MEKYKYVIVGGGLAGGRAAAGVREIDQEGSLVIVTREDRYPYQRPPLSKSYLVGQAGLDQVYLRDEAFYAENNIEVWRDVVASRLERAEHRLILEDGRTLDYEKLLLATGGYARRPRFPGHDLPNAFVLRTIGDSDAIKRAAQKARRALVLGGSFIGSEVAASLTQLGVQVTMAFRESRLLQRIAPAALSTHLQARYTEKGVDLRPGTQVSALEGDGRVQRAVLDGQGGGLDVQMVVMGIGIGLYTDLARDAGLEMTRDDAVAVDEYLCSSDPDVYAAGDVAAWPDPTFGKRLRVEHWDVARNQGRRAGRNMAGEGKPYTTLPYFFSDLFDLSFEAWGDLDVSDRTVLRGDLQGQSFAFYYFRDGKMSGVLAAGRPDEERKPMQALVRARAAYEDVADKLRDESVDLGSIM